MPDECYMEITMRESDRPAFERAVNDMLPGWHGVIWSETISEDNVFTGIMEEVSYAWKEELFELAESGFNFYGRHAAGIEYDRAEFVAWGGKLNSLDCDVDEGFVAPFNLRTMKIPSHFKQRVRNFVAAMESMIDYLNEEEQHG